ncbi:MAG: lipopolysaccharide heptosyltransferase family protein, partial [Gammaproteobacteria bacterium]|nr:lipopolysaccharide heptosyltransferase family protein [Gammaproteobacteria bacterium]
EKPEYEYNTDLAAFMANYYDVDYSFTLKPPLLKFPHIKIQKIKENFYTDNKIKSDKKLVFIHAGSGGSATNLSIEQYAELIKLLAENKSLYFVLTAGPGEENIAKQLSERIKYCDHVIHHSDKGIAEFAKLLSICNLFISGSTGTLHLAGALNIATVAFYPKRKSATSLRWATLNEKDRSLAFSSNVENSRSLNVTLYNCYQEIKNRYFIDNNLYQ